MTARTEDRVRLGHIETFLRQQPAGLVIQVVNTGLVALVMSMAWPLSWVLAWAATVGLITLGRFALWCRHRRGPDSVATADRLARQFTVLAGLTGMAWGASGVVFFPHDLDAVQGFVIVVLAGMSAGAVATMSSYFPAFAAFLICALAPIVVRLLIADDMVHMTLGVMGGVFFLGLFATGRNLHRTLAESLHARFQKSDLIEELNEARLKAEAASAAKTAFLANVSHELRTPLNAIIGFSEIIQNEIFGPAGHPQYREYARDIYDSGGHLLSLINDILDLSKIEVGKFEIQEEWVDVAESVQRTVRLMRGRADEDGIALRYRVPADFPPLRADARVFRQILLNLLSNAVKFTPENGQVTVVAGLAADGRMAIRVSDNGIGMSKEEIVIAMSPFGQIETSLNRKYEGTGLGLPLSRHLVDLHGGRLEIKSVPGRGTRATVSFPAARVQVPPQVGDALCAKPAAKKAS